MNKNNQKSIKSELRVNLTSIPTDQAGVPLTRKRSEGPFPRVPNSAILSICKHMERNGFSEDDYDYYDLEMLYPSDEEIRNYYKTYRPHIVGLSAPISTCYSQVKRVSKIIREELPETLIVMGGYLAGSSEAVVRCTDVDMTVVGNGEKAWLAILNLLTQEQLSNGPRNIDIEELKKIKGMFVVDKQGNIHSNGFGDSIPGSDIPFFDYDFYERALKDKPEQIHNYFRDYSITGSEYFLFDPRATDPNKKNKMVASIFTTKGCVAACTFCQREGTGGKSGYWVMNLEDLDSHLEFIKTKFNVGFIKILDESFGQIKEYTVAVAKLLKKHDMLWMAV